MGGFRLVMELARGGSITTLAIFLGLSAVCYVAFVGPVLFKFLCRLNFGRC